MSFGWELFVWHGFLRKLAERYDRVIVACRTGHDLLYRDFATDIIHYDPTTNETDMWKNHREPDIHHFHQHYTDMLPCVTVVHHDAYPTRWWDSESWRQRQDLTSFGVYAPDSQGYDVLMIVRNTVKCGTGYRNWPREHAKEFAHRIGKLGFSVACIGTSDAAAWVEGTEDRRDLPLDQLAGLMANSRVIVGPQSGPIHFGSLCLLPQICWQTCQEHATRTEIGWNPFGVPVITIPSDIVYWKKRKMWLPSVQDTITATLQMIQKGNR